MYVKIPEWRRHNIKQSESDKNKQADLTVSPCQYSAGRMEILELTVL